MTDKKWPSEIRDFVAHVAKRYPKGEHRFAVISVEVIDKDHLRSGEHMFERVKKQ